MAKEKKGQKFGRNRDRNPSSRLQAQRTARNKRLAVERHEKRMGKIATRKAFRLAHGGMTPAQWAKLQATLPRAIREAA